MNKILELNKEEINYVSGGKNDTASSIGGSIGTLIGAYFGQQAWSQLAKFHTPASIKTVAALGVTLIVNKIGHIVFGTVLSGFLNVYEDTKGTYRAIFGSGSTDHSEL
ncbi:MAG: hypothetical protein KKE11_01095 [Gammaproteobacteria bacterium]|nr:hypothetical protein [Gammaproteobacteria bacterium]